MFTYNSYHRRTNSWLAATGYTLDPNTGITANPTSSGLHAASTLDTAGHLLELKNTGGASTVLSDQSYNWGASTCTGGSIKPHQNQRASMTDLAHSSTVTTYCYDDRGRLTSASTAGGTSYTYSYDLDGNIKTGSAGSHSYNAVDQITDTGFTYDADGNQTANTATDAYSYNGHDQTTSITPAGGSPIGYSYIGTSQNQRATAGNLTYSNGLAGVQSQAPAGADTMYFVRDPQGNLLATFTRSSGGTYGTEYFYYADGLGNIAGLTTTAGASQSIYSYDPYGGHLTTGGTNTTLTAANPYRYKSEYEDTATGLYKMGARYYNPATGNWTQRDNLNAIGDPNNANRYAAFGDDPINAADPSGKSFLDDLASGLGIASTVSSGIGNLLDAAGAPAIGGIFDVGGAIASVGAASASCLGGSSTCGKDSITAGVDLATFGVAGGLTGIGNEAGAAGVSGGGLGFDISQLF